MRISWIEIDFTSTCVYMYNGRQAGRSEKDMGKIVLICFICFNLKFLTCIAKKNLSNKINFSVHVDFIATSFGFILFFSFY